jgi:hypothetical protein
MVFFIPLLPAGSFPRFRLEEGLKGNSTRGDADTGAPPA